MIAGSKAMFKGSGIINGEGANSISKINAGMRWESKRAMNTRPINILEARISRLQSRRVSSS